MSDFKVGDWAIYAEFELCQVVKLVDDKRILVKSTITNAVMNVQSIFCLHATTEEIKAWRRL